MHFTSVIGWHPSQGVFPPLRFKLWIFHDPDQHKVLTSDEMSVLVCGNRPLWLYLNIYLPTQAEADAGVLTAGAVSATAVGD